MPDNLLNHSEKCWFCYLRIIAEHVTAAVGQKKSRLAFAKAISKFWDFYAKVWLSLT